jgi:hypothetical protein
MSVCLSLLLGGEHATVRAQNNAAQACRDRPGRTLLENRSGRVFLARQTVSVCFRKARVPYNLQPPQWRPQVSSSGGGGLLRVAINGSRVAYTHEFFSQDEHYVSFEVRNAKRPANRFERVYQLGSVNNQGRDHEAFDLALCASGQIVFIVGKRVGTDQGPPATYEVRISRGRRTRLLDEGSTIQPGTLRATADRISWINARAVRSTSTRCSSPTQSVPTPKLTSDQIFGE